MIKISKTFSIIIITLVILGLILPFSNIFAQENLQDPLKEVSNKVDELIELKDDNTLSDEEKEIKEIQVRKEALEKIITLSLIETENLIIKLSALELVSENQIAIKDSFVEILKNNEVYSKELGEKIKEENLSLDDVKNLAQEYKDWRDENYNKYIKKITVFLLTFQEKQVLKTAEIRLEKIMSDLKKLEDLKIIKKDDTLKFITASTKNLANAQILNSKAEEKIMLAIERDILEVASSTESMTATSTAEAIMMLAVEPEEQLGEVEKEAATSSIEIILEEDEAQSLVEESLQEIKNAYANFIDISNKVSQRLRLR